MIDEGETAMKYMLLLYANESAFQALPKAEAERGVAAYRAYTEALTQAGVRVASDRLPASLRLPFYISQIGRTSTTPWLAPGQRAAQDSAASRSGASMM